MMNLCFLLLPRASSVVMMAKYAISSQITLFFRWVGSARPGIAVEWVEVDDGAAAVVYVHCRSAVVSDDCSVQKLHNF